MAKNPDTQNIKLMSQADLKIKHSEDLERDKDDLKFYQDQYGQNTNHPKIALTLNNIGATYLALENPKEGLPYTEKALEMCYDLYGQNAIHPQIASCLGNIGDIYLELKNFEEGLSYMEKALKMYQEIPGQDANVANRLDKIGGAYHNSGKAAEGLSYKEAALTMYKKIYGQDANHHDIAMCLHNIGSTYLSLRKHGEALEYSNKALVMVEELYKDFPPFELMQIYANIAFVHYSSGDKVNALKFISQAYKTSYIVRGPDNEYTNDIKARVDDLKPEVIKNLATSNKRTEIEEIIKVLGPTLISEKECSDYINGTGISSSPNPTPNHSRLDHTFIYTEQPSHLEASGNNEDND